MNFHPGFVRELSRNPWDKATSGIYLDWLKDEGQNPVMAELVEWLRNRPWMIPGSPLQRKYLEQIVPPHWGYSRWKLSLAKAQPQMTLTGRGDWHRGFAFGNGWATVVSCSLAAWMRGARWICGRHPVQTVWITGFATPDMVMPTQWRWHQCDYQHQVVGDLLPPAIFTLLQLGEVDRVAARQPARKYLTSQEAVNDLSLAALHYGRKLAWGEMA